MSAERFTYTCTDGVWSCAYLGFTGEGDTPEEAREALHGHCPADVRALGVGADPMRALLEAYRAVRHWLFGCHMSECFAHSFYRSLWECSRCGNLYDGSGE